MTLSEYHKAFLQAWEDGVYKIDCGSIKRAQSVRASLYSSKKTMDEDTREKADGIRVSVDGQYIFLYKKNYED